MQVEAVFRGLYLVFLSNLSDIVPISEQNIYKQNLPRPLLCNYLPTPFHGKHSKRSESARQRRSSTVLARGLGARSPHKNQQQSGLEITPSPLSHQVIRPEFLWSLECSFQTIPTLATTHYLQV